MTTPQYDDAAIIYDDPAVRYDGGCIATITYDEPGISYDELEITFNGCDHRTGTPVVEQATGGGYGARLDANSRRARLRTIIRDDDDLMALI